jgi:hypothetical protein
MTRATVFHRIHLFRRVLEFAFPPLRRRREAKLRDQIRRLCHEGAREPVFFRD